MTKKKSLIWEIIKDNSIKGYLFGTMHVSGKVAFSNFELIQGLIDSCDCLATEVPLDQETQKEMGRHMSFPKYTSLSEILSEKRYNKYNNQLIKHFDLELDIFNKIMPLFLINVITQKSLTKDLSLLHMSMDAECWNYASEKGLHLTSVESLEDHINTLYSIPLEYQLNALKAAMSNLPNFKKKAKEMLEVYVTQDIHSLYKSSKKSLKEIKDILLYSRNVKMADNISEILKEYKGFFAFGAGHLSGEMGVIRLLKQKGYKVKPSPLAKELTPSLAL